MRSTAVNAELALLLEVAAAPTPGNVDRERDLAELRFEHFLAGATGARDGLAIAADGGAVGTAFERAIEGMSKQSGGNTQFGSILLLTPLVRAAADGELSPAGASRVVEGTTVEDTAGFYRAFDHVDVRVDEPPSEGELPDVRLGADAVPELEERGLALSEIMTVAADRDGIAREWVDGFERTFEAADRLAALDGPVLERAAATHLWLLAGEPDTLIAVAHDETVAEEVRDRAADLVDDDGSPRDLEVVRAFAVELVERGINPGTTADLLAGGLFVALERGEVSV